MGVANRKFHPYSPEPCSTPPYLHSMTPPLSLDMWGWCIERSPRRRRCEAGRVHDASRASPWKGATDDDGVAGLSGRCEFDDEICRAGGDALGLGGRHVFDRGDASGGVRDGGDYDN
jgi:hypothetical protein